MRYASSMSLKDLSIRPFRPEDAQQLDLFREQYWDANLEAPHGYSAQGVETAIAEKDGKTVGALTATKVVIFDFIQDRSASGPDRMAAVLMLERTLAYVAQQGGFTDAYVAIPSHLTSYIEMVKRCGYSETIQGCTVFRRPLRKEIVPYLGDARDNTEGNTVK